MLPRALILAATLSSLALTTSVQGAASANPTKQDFADQNDLSSILATEMMAMNPRNEPSSAAVKGLADTSVAVKRSIVESKWDCGGSTDKDENDDDGEKDHRHGHHGHQEHHGHGHPGDGPDRDQNGPHENQPSWTATFTVTIPTPTSTGHGVYPTMTNQPNSVATTYLKGDQGSAMMGLVAIVLAACLV